MSVKLPNTYTKRETRISKVSQENVYAYIKDVELNGVPRVVAFANHIDKGIYDHTPAEINQKIKYFQNNHPAYAMLKEMVMQEEKDWMLKRSSALQNKALDLLSNLLDKANDIAKDPESDAKELNVAVSTLKSIMPAFNAVKGKMEYEPDNTATKKKRAQEYIN